MYFISYITYIYIIYLYIYISRYIIYVLYIIIFMLYIYYVINYNIYILTYIYIYSIHHWRIFRSSYRKLAWVGFEPTTTEFRSDAVTDWAIRPWVQLALRANFVQLLQFHLFVQCSLFFVHVSFRSLPSSVATFALSEVSHR